MSLVSDHERETIHTRAALAAITRCAQPAVVVDEEEVKELDAAVWKRRHALNRLYDEVAILEAARALLERE